MHLLTPDPNFLPLLPNPAIIRQYEQAHCLVRILAAILSGLLLAAAFPKWDQTYLLIFALVPLLWALRGQTLKAAFWLGLVSGLAHYVALLYWIVYVTHVFAGPGAPALGP